MSPRIVVQLAVTLLSISINPNGGTYLDSITSVSFVEDYGTIKHIEDPVRVGYKFIKYNHTGGGYFVNKTYTFDNLNGELTAIYEIIPYSIYYENITDSEREYLNNGLVLD